MALAGYVNERPILGCRVRALNDRLWVRIAFHRALKSTGAAGDL